jgi:predicted RNA binding protein YcfA (HicA-like mRNA interferase family)
MRFRELEKILKDDGGQYVGTKGSHHHYKHPTKPGKVTIPFHNTDLKIQTANSILTQAGLK